MPLILDSTATTLISAMVPDLARHTPQAPSFAMEDALLEAARKFCEESNVWRAYDVTLLTTVANQAAYTYTSPAGAEINHVHTAWDNTGAELAVELPGDTDESEPGSSDSTWKVGRQSGTKLSVTPAPNASGTVVTGSISYRPTVSATTIPTDLYSRWRKAIAHGAAAALVAELNKPWSNPAAVVYHDAEFNKGVTEASNEAGAVRRTRLRVKVW